MELAQVSDHGLAKVVLTVAVLADTLHRFTLVMHGVGLPVQVDGALPDTFRDQAEVIVTGPLVRHNGWMIEGTAVIAKCPGNYQPAPARQIETKFQ